MGGLRFGRPGEAPGRQTNEFRDTCLNVIRESWEKLGKRTRLLVARAA